MHLIDPELLRCFVVVAEAGSFTAGGERVALSQSGVSVRIKKLEGLLGCRLFERTSRSVALSPQGRKLIDDAKRVLDLNEAIVRRFREPEMVGHLRIGFADYVVPGTLQTVLARFRRIYPHVTIEVMTGLGLDLVPRFEQRKLDLVIAGVEKATDEVELIYSEPLYWCAAPEFDTCVEPLPLVSLPAPCSHRAAGIAQLNAVGRVFSQVFTSSSVAGVRAAACAGLGVAVLPASAFDKSCRKLSSAEGFPVLPSVRIGAFSHRDADDLVATFIAFFRDATPWVRGEAVAA